MMHSEAREAELSALQRYLAGRETYDDAHARLSTRLGVQVFNLNTPSVLPAGAFSVELSSDLNYDPRQFGSPRRVATVVEIGDSDDRFMKRIDHARLAHSAATVGERVAQGTASAIADLTDAEASGSTHLPLRYGSKRTSETIERLRSSGIDYISFLLYRLSERLNRLEASEMTLTAAGASDKPTGIVSSSTDKATFDDQLGTSLVDTMRRMPDLIDQAYVSADLGYPSASEVEDGGRTGYMMHPSTWTLVEDMAADIGEAMLQLLLETPTPPVPTADRHAFGHPVWFNGAMASPDADTMAFASDDAAVLFGNFSYYLIIDHGPLELVRYEGDVLRRSGSVEFELRRWTDGGYMGLPSTVASPAVINAKAA